MFCKKLIYILLVIFTVTFMITMSISSNLYQHEETITYFPPHKNATFLEVNTHLSLKQKKQNKSQKKYTIVWEMMSLLDRSAYLRQDMGFIFKNGKLKKTVGKKNWKQHTNELAVAKKLSFFHSGYFQAISFHYAEIHEENDGLIKSMQDMSESQLYVINSQLEDKFLSFHKPTNSFEKEWATVLQTTTKHHLQEQWEKGMQFFELPPAQFIPIPLTDLSQYAKKTLPGGYTKQQTYEIIGHLMEGLYKNYLLGIKKENGTIVDPIDSLIPLILLNKNKKELLVLIYTKENEYVLFKQKIS